MLCRKGRVHHRRCTLPILHIKSLLFLKKILLRPLFNELFGEHVCSGLGRSVHTDAFNHALRTLLCSKCCYRLLCHNLKLFDFPMNCNLVEVRIILLKFHTTGGVLPILGGDIPGHSGNPTRLLFSALKYNLHPITFSLLCHSS